MALNVLLLVYSGTGNTHYLSRLFEADLLRRGHRVTLHQIDRLPFGWQLPDIDLVGFGTPVYHAAPPHHVLRFLQSVAGRGRPLFTFLTMGALWRRLWENAAAGGGAARLSPGDRIRGDLSRLGLRRATQSRVMDQPPA